MSWFTDLASKTEHLLNTIDSSAAEALQKARANTPSRPPAENMQAGEQWTMSTQSARGMKLRRANHRRSVSGGVTHTDSYSDSPTLAQEVSSVVTSRASEVEGGILRSSQGHTDRSPDEGREDEQIVLLRREVDSVNRELAQLLDRTKRSEKVGGELRAKLDTSQTQLNDTERQCRRLQQKEMDLLESLKSKDGQLAVLKVRLEENDNELKSKQAVVERLQMENDRLMEAHGENGLGSRDLVERLQQRADHADKDRLQLQQLLDSTHQQHNTEVDELRDEQARLREQLKSAESRLQQEQFQLSQLSCQRGQWRSSAEAAAADLTDYKVKAQRLLASKDQLIDSLKQQQHHPSLPNTSSSSSCSDDVTTSSTWPERAQLLAERDSLQLHVQQLEEQLQHVEAVGVEQKNGADRRDRVWEQQMAEQRRITEECGAELEAQRQEVREVREEMSRIRKQCVNTVQQKNSELQHLQQQLTAARCISSTEAELESRMRSLTENLIAKQTCIESLNTENRTLKVQLDRSQNELLQAVSICGQNNGVQYNSSDKEALRQRSCLVDLGSSYLQQQNQQVGYASSSALGSGLVRRRMYSCVDSVSIRLAVFLRRYPVARVMVLVYVVLLHLWASVVLYTYTPEVHHNGCLTHNNTSTANNI